MQFQQNLNVTIQDLKMQVGQLVNTVRGVSVVTLRSGRELPQQSTPQPKSRLINAKSEPKVNSQGRDQHPTPRYYQTNSKVCEILQGVMHALKEEAERRSRNGRSHATLIKNEEVIVESQQVLPKKCRAPNIFFVSCIIGNCTFANAMLDLGASINVMPSSIYKFLNFGDLEPTGMII
ncbi:hypothetical protein CR513_33890, partial [Mucuna pruriens]